MNYHEQLRASYTIKLREYMGQLPEFCEDFLRGIADNTQIRTRIGYAFDLKLFFNYLCNYRRAFEGVDAVFFTHENLKKVTADDIEAFMDYLSLYYKTPASSAGADGADTDTCALLQVQNAEQGKSRKLAAVRSLFAYFVKKRILEVNPAALVDFPKLRKKVITRLEVDEIARLLDEVETGEKLTPAEQKYHKHTKLRDLAIITLLLGTGIRLSECVGIDISHIDFDTSGIRIIRKGGNEQIVYFGDEVMDALELYLTERAAGTPAPGHEDALFLSMQKKRITCRAVQNLVKKYAKRITALKNISPHKLRSTFGTELYRETGDIYLVADILGHSDVNTTRKHYAEQNEHAKRRAAKQIRLRKE